MKPWASAAQSQRGVALPLALFALVMLSGLLLAFLTMAGMEPTISATLHDTTRARYLSEAGLEWAFDQLATLPAAFADYDAYWGNVLVTNGGTIATDQALFPGLPQLGVFTVQVRNDDVSFGNPTALTGLGPDGGGVASDQNGALIITSTGVLNGVTRQVQAVMRRPRFEPPRAGLGLPGAAASTGFDGNSFVISGNDTNLDGTPGACAPVLGIGVADVVKEESVERTLSRVQKNNVTGRRQVPTNPGSGDNTISPDDSLTPSKIREFVSSVKPLVNFRPEPGDYNSIGDACATDWSSPNCWGTRDRPKIIYVRGDAFPGDSDLSIAGNSTGAGILIIEDGELSLGGNFRWEGPIVITGSNVGIRYRGGGHQVVLGSVIVNETLAADPILEADVRGNGEIRYSCQALDNVRNSRGLKRLTSWREL